MKIHFLQHLPFEDAAGIRDWMDARGHQFSRTAFFAGDSLPDPADIDWLVVLGGFMNIYEENRYPWLADEKRFIADVIDRGDVVLGICLGAQLVADILGGPVTRNREPEIGWHPVRLTADAGQSPVFDALPNEFTAFHWHGDTFDIPPGAVRTVESEACANQAFSFEDRVIGLQFHLESTRESVESLITECADEMVAAPFVQTAGQMRGNYPLLPELRGHLTTLLDAIGESTK